MTRYPGPTLGQIGMGLLWLAAVLLGSVLLWQYKSTPGAAFDAPRTWPAGTRIERSDGRPVLVMFAHPKCPCTRASIGELAVILSETRGAVDARVLFEQPADVSNDWTVTDTWRAASAIPGVTVSADHAGEEAHRFGAATSGLVVLYGGDGRLLFAGGITSARGHAGDSEGRRAILALLSRGVANRSHGPVFGCPLEGEGEQRREAWMSPPKRP